MVGPSWTKIPSGKPLSRSDRPVLAPGRMQKGALGSSQGAMHAHSLMHSTLATPPSITVPHPHPVQVRQGHGLDPVQDGLLLRGQTHGVQHRQPPLRCEGVGGRSAPTANDLGDAAGAMPA